MSKEEWKSIKGYEGFYEISNKGKVKSKKRTIKRKDGKPYSVKETLLNPYVDKDGYLRLELNKNGYAKKYYVHRLVGIAFIENAKNKLEINHIDANKKNNCVENLEWVTSKENSIHASKNGLLKEQTGKNNPNIKLVEEDVLLIRKLNKEGKTKSEISKLIGTSKSNVDNIVYGYTWKWLKEV